jgi:hypothetical protein
VAEAPADGVLLPDFDLAEFDVVEVHVLFPFVL